MKMIETYLMDLVTPIGINITIKTPIDLHFVTVWFIANINDSVIKNKYCKINYLYIIFPSHVL